MQTQIEISAKKWLNIPDQHIDGDDQSKLDSFIAGVKSDTAKEYWQKNMYSRSGVFLLYRQYIRDIQSNYLTFEEWFNEKYPQETSDINGPII